MVTMDSSYKTPVCRSSRIGSWIVVAAMALDGCSLADSGSSADQRKSLAMLVEFIKTVPGTR